MLVAKPSSAPAMKTGQSILIVEDEVDLADVLSYQLRREGYDCRVVHDGSAAIAEIERRPPDLIVLDRMLPKTTGDEVAMKIKSESRLAHIPIIMVTAKAEETDELVGFAIGADDYIHKPFSPKLLAARIQAVLRRKAAAAKNPEIVRVGPILLDRGKHLVTVQEEPIQLTATEFRVLLALMAARERVLSREQLIDAVLGHGVAVTQRTIDVHIAALRKKLMSAAGWIHTIRGVGYTLRAPSASDLEE